MSIDSLFTLFLVSVLRLSVGSFRGYESIDITRDSIPTESELIDRRGDPVDKSLCAQCVAVCCSAVQCVEKLFCV